MRISLVFLNPNMMVVVIYYTVAIIFLQNIAHLFYCDIPNLFESGYCWIFLLVWLGLLSTLSASRIHSYTPLITTTSGFPTSSCSVAVLYLHPYTSLINRVIIFVHRQTTAIFHPWLIIITPRSKLQWFLSPLISDAIYFSTGNTVF